MGGLEAARPHFGAIIDKLDAYCWASKALDVDARYAMLLIDVCV